MTVPPWVLAVFLAFALAQFALVAMWMMRADRRLALMEQTLEAIAEQLKTNNLAVLTQRVSSLELASKDHKQAHDRNRERLGELHKELLREIDRAKDDAVDRATRRTSSSGLHSIHTGE